MLHTLHGENNDLMKASTSYRYLKWRLNPIFLTTYLLKLFTSQFCVKTSQAYGKSLKCRKGVSIVHCKHILANLAKLKNNLVRVRRRLCWLRWCRSCSCRSNGCWRCWGNQLKILDRGNSDPSSKVEAPTLQLFMPPWRLVLEN